MNFEESFARIHEINRHTLAIMAEIERRQTPSLGPPFDPRVGMKLHRERMAHLKMRLKQIDETLRRLKGLQ